MCTITASGTTIRKQGVGLSSGGGANLYVMVENNPISQWGLLRSNDTHLLCESPAGTSGQVLRRVLGWLAATG
jgi:hypothetical protein